MNTLPSKSLPISYLPGVYVIHFGTGKFYVGSSVNVKKRRIGHLSSLRRGASHCVALQRAFEKYGEVKMIFRVLEYCSQDIVRDRELHWMAQLDSLNGYNVANNTTAPMTGRKHTDATKALMSEKSKHIKANLGRKFTQAHKDKIAAANRKPKSRRHTPEMNEANRLRNSGDKSTFRGRKHTAISRAINSLKHLGKGAGKDSAVKRQVKVLELVTGKATYHDTTKFAREFTGITYSQFYKKVGTFKSANGYLFFYADDPKISIK